MLACYLLSYPSPGNIWFSIRLKCCSTKWEMGETVITNVYKSKVSDETQIGGRGELTVIETLWNSVIMHKSSFPQVVTLLVRCWDFVFRPQGSCVNLLETLLTVRLKPSETDTASYLYRFYVHQNPPSLFLNPQTFDKLPEAQVNLMRHFDFHVYLFWLKKFCLSTANLFIKIFCYLLTEWFDRRYMRDM